MKNLLSGVALATCLTFFFISCSKNKNYYAISDYTSGMLNTRSWQGSAHGYVKGDTAFPAETVAWPKRFYRTLDTTFTIEKINNFAINVAGTRLVFRSVDSVLKLVTYDSVYANSDKSFLVFDYGLDKMTCELHHNEDFNTLAGKYYQKNMVMTSIH